MKPNRHTRMPVYPCLLTLAVIAALAITEETTAADPDPYGILLKPIPDKVVVLTFDDACLSHGTFVAPLLKMHGFGATFYITMFGRTALDKTQYMSWEQARALEGMGFEVGNHSFGHGYIVRSAHHLSIFSEFRSPGNSVAVVLGR